MKKLSVAFITLALLSIPIAGGAQQGDCVLLERTLRLGSSGEDVSALQQYLKEERYFFMEPTGYFGRVTEGALKAWQAAKGIVSNGTPETTGWGVAGPRTRAIINARCTTTTTPAMLQGVPERGAAPLSVMFTARIPAASTGYRIDFGDGEDERIQPQRGCSNIYGGACADPTVRHTYEEEGTFTARLMYQPPWSCTGPAGCPTVMPREQEVDNFTIRVGDVSTGLAPVILGVNGPASLAVEEMGTWNIRVSDGSGNLTYSVSWGDEGILGQISFFGGVRPTQSTGTFTHAYQAGGMYSARFTVSNAHGSASKTLPVLVGSANYGLYSFAPYPENGAAPLTVTFTIQSPGVFSTAQGAKTFLVDFGDGTPAASVDCSASFPYQQCVVQHTYTKVGTYTARLIDRGGCTTDATGCLGSPASEVAHALVTVGVNFGDYLRPACTADARQCPDGTFVGRTGANCAFDCRAHGGDLTR